MRQAVGGGEDPGGRALASGLRDRDAQGPRTARPPVPGAEIHPRPPQRRWTPTPARRARHRHDETHTLPRAAEKLNPSRSRTRTKSVTPVPARSHAHHAPRQCALGTQRATHTTLSFTLSDTGQPWQPPRLTLHTHTHAGSLSTEPPPFHHLSRKVGPGTPTLLSPGCSQRHPKVPQIGTSLGEHPGISGPGAGPHPAPGPRPLSPRHGRSSCRGAPLAVPLLAPRPPQPPPRPRRPVGRHPGWGRGQGLPDSHSGHWLAEAAPPRPIAARGRGLLGWGAWAGLGGRFDRPEPPASCAVRRPPAKEWARRVGGAAGDRGRALPLGLVRPGRRREPAHPGDVPLSPSGWGRTFPLSRVSFLPLRWGG